MKRIRTFWERHFLGMEAITTGLMTLVFSVWFFAFDGQHHVDESMQGNRGTAYTTIAGIAGTLLGFSIAVTSIVLNLSSAHGMKKLRKSKQYPKIWETFISTGRMLGMLTIVALFCLFIDTDRTPNSWLTIPLCFLLLLSIWRVVRVLWILENIIELVVKRIDLFSNKSQSEVLTSGERDCSPPPV